MKKLTFDHFVTISGTQANKYQRRGQSMMNVLNEFSNEICSAITYFGAAEIDPFYRDENIPAFLKYLLVNHVALPVETAPEQAKQVGLRPETVKAGQFYRTTSEDVLRNNKDVLFFGVQDLTLKIHLAIICPDKELYHGKTVKPSRDGDWSYWDSFYEVPAPTFK
jgi:hypothetical protein